MHEYLSPGRFIDSDHPSVVEFAEKHRGASRDPLEQAIHLYYAVREAVRYNPYTFSRDPQTLCGSYALATGESYCVPKATLLAGAARHCGIAARIGLADVRNHLSTPRLLELLKSDVFAMHGYTELYLNGSLGQGHACVQPGLVRPVQCGAAGIRRDQRQRFPSLQSRRREIDGVPDRSRPVHRRAGKVLLRTP